MKLLAIDISYTYLTAVIVTFTLAYVPARVALESSFPPFGSVFITSLVVSVIVATGTTPLLQSWYGPLTVATWHRIVPIIVTSSVFAFLSISAFAMLGLALLGVFYGGHIEFLDWKTRIKKSQYEPEERRNE